MLEIEPLPQDTIETPPARIIRGPDGKFLPGTQPPKPITVANAREMQSRAISLSRQRAREGAVQALIERGRLPLGTAPDGGDEWREIIAHATDVYAGSTSAKGLASLGEFIGRSMGHLSIDKQGESGGISIDIGEDIARELVSVLALRIQSGQE